jgi:hypothetical protein
MTEFYFSDDFLRAPVERYLAADISRAIPAIFRTRMLTAAIPRALISNSTKPAAVGLSIGAARSFSHGNATASALSNLEWDGKTAYATVYEIDEEGNYYAMWMLLETDGS